MTTVPLQTGGPGLGTSVVLVLVGLGLLAVFARRSGQRLLTMLRTEAAAAGEVVPGMVELEGTVTPAGETFDASAGTKTAEAVVIQSRQSGGSNDQNEGIPGLGLPIPQQLAPAALNDVSARAFYLEDDSGRVLVDAANADVSLDSDYSRNDQLTDYARVEAWLEPGDDVYVLGEAVPAAAYSERATSPGGVLREVARFLKADIRRTAEDVVDEGELVVTRTPRTAEFLVSDTSDGRSLLRQGLMAAFWTGAGLLSLGAGLSFLAGALGL
jgi:hypothetical protein